MPWSLISLLSNLFQSRFCLHHSVRIALVEFTKEFHPLGSTELATIRPCFTLTFAWFDIVMHVFISRHSLSSVLVYLIGISFPVFSHIFFFIILLTFKYWYALGLALTLFIFSRYTCYLGNFITAIYTLKTLKFISLFTARICICNKNSSYHHIVLCTR